MINKIYYQYCTLNTFVSILENKKMWFGNPLKMNDCNELIQFYVKLKEYCKDKNNKVSNWCGKVIENINNGQNQVFVSCFTEEKDLLSQWIQYADYGRGVALGFDLNKITESNERIDRRKIEYIDGISEREINSFNALSLTRSSDLLLEKYANEQNPMREISTLLDFGIGYKSKCWEHEKETRLIYNCGDYKLNGDDWNERYNENATEVKFTTNGSNIKSHVEIEIKADYLKEIIIGPLCGIKTNELANIMSMAFPDLKTEVKISESEITLRP